MNNVAEITKMIFEMQENLIKMGRMINTIETKVELPKDKPKVNVQDMGGDAGGYNFIPANKL